MTDYVTHAFVQRHWRSKSKAGDETVTQRKVRLGEGTLSIRKVVIRDFVRWFRDTDDDEYPHEVKHLKIGRSHEEDSIPADELIERADLLAMIQAHHTPREKAMLAVLHESGLRAGEFSALNVRSVQFDEYGAVLTLPKKTKGKRTKGLKTGRQPESRRRDRPPQRRGDPRSRGARGAEAARRSRWAACLIVLGRLSRPGAAEAGGPQTP